MKRRDVRVTVNLPPDIVAALDGAVSAGTARSRSELVILALRRELAARRRDAIDAEFALMADDAAYREEVAALNREFAVADWEAFRLAEFNQ